MTMRPRDMPPATTHIRQVERSLTRHTRTSPGRTLLLAIVGAIIAVVTLCL